MEQPEESHDEETVHDAEAEEPQPVYTYADLLKFEPANIYSSVGRMTLSTKPSAPEWSLGTSTREQGQNVVSSKAVARMHFLGKQSPGPCYDIGGTDKFYYKNFGTIKFAGRGVIEQKELPDYYFRDDLTFDVNRADLARRQAASNVKFGQAQRFPSLQSRFARMPGAIYDQTLPQDKNAYSFGYRRETGAGNPLALQISTNELVGPGSYIRHKQYGGQNDGPYCKFGTGPNRAPVEAGWTKNQTYDTQGSIGMQPESKKETAQAYTFGKRVRDAPAGMFNQHMTYLPPKIRIEHPRF